MKIALLGTISGEQAQERQASLLDLFASFDDEVVFDVDERVEMVFSFGGDGTFLRVARKVGKLGIPIVGVNTGHLGFLADVQPEELAHFVESLHRGDYEVRERSVLCVEIHPAGSPDAPRVAYALNEVAVTKHDTASMISIHTFVNEEKLITYQSDGLLVVTPTGSTAYSLSAGGPIIHPQAEVFMLNAVAPHSLNMRPIILSDDKEITLVADSRSGRFLVTVDGESESFATGTRLVLRKASYKIRVVKQTGNTYFRTLQEKMMWGIR
jgi:NAD+ kinase